MQEQKLKNIRELSAEDRYGYLIKQVSALQEVWLIHEDGKFVQMGDEEENVSIPVWPEKEFAEMMLVQDWKDYSVESMEVHEFMEWLQELEKENVDIAGFPLDELSTIVVSAEEMRNHLLHELQ